MNYCKQYSKTINKPKFNLKQNEMKRKLLSLFAALAMAATMSAQVTYTCTAGTNFDGDEGIAKLFDGNTETKFCGNAGDGTYALFTASDPVYVWAYEMTTANDNSNYGRLVKKWTLYGTNDATVGANPDAEGWVVLSDLGRNNFVQQKNYYTQRFFCEKNIMKPFKYFKIVLNESAGYKKDGDEATYYDGTIQLSEFKLLAETNRVTTYKWKASTQDNSKKAVDLLLGQKWEGSNLAGNWVTIETGDGQAYAVKSYSFSTHDDGDWSERAPKSWKIEGSNDNTNWTLIDEVVNDETIQNANYTTFEFTPSNTTDKFRYIKLTLVAMKGTGWTQVGEFHVLSTSDVSDAQYYTNLVDNAKATKAGYETLMGESDPWCQEYATFFNGLDLDGVLAAAISSSDYATLEAKLAEAENNAIGQALNLFVNGANYAAIAGSGDKCWGDGHYSQLFDGKDGCEGRPASKWGGNNFPQYVIFRVKAAFKPFFYKLVTGNDTANNTGRNWKTWNVYGGNFTSFSAATDSTTTNWTLLDERVDVSEEYLPMKNFYPATFDFNKGVSEEYLYYMVKVIAPHGGTQQQMSEMYLCTEDEFEAIRQPLVEELAEFADGLEDLAVEPGLEGDKATFAELYAELKTTSDAVRMTKVYNDLVALKEKLESSAAFVAGDCAQVLSGNTAWGDNENWTKLVDGNIQTKWGGGMPEGGSYVIFRTYEAKTYNQYMLVTGNDTKNSPDRNWKTWKIYGIAGKVTDSSATRDNAAWTLLDQKTDIGQDRLPGANFAPAYFNFSEEWTKSYKYFKIEVEAAYNNGGSIQMSEFKMLTDEQYEEIRQEYVDSLVKVGTAIAEEYAGATVPDALKQQILAEGQVKAAAVQTAVADDLLPAFTAALNYITVEAPALIAAAQLEKVDGVYQIANAYNLASFAAVVNGGENDADAVVTADIDMTGFEWPAPIGDWTVSGINSAYKGHFDGQGHTISNLVYTTAKNWHGFFGVLTSGALVENFNIAGTITIASGNSNVGVVGYMRDNSTTVRNIKSSLNINNNSLGARVGGIVGTIDAGTATVDRCTYSGTLDGNDNEGNGNYGGIVGYFANNANAIGNITNCLFDGKVINSNASPGNCTFGGIVGYCNAGKATIKNCLSIGEVQSKIAAQFFGKLNGNNSTFVNCYYKGSFVNGNGSGGTASGEAPVLVTDEQLASGFVAAKLAPAFRQTLGTDKYPVLDDTKALVAEITDAGYATLFVEDVDLTVPEGVEAFAGVVDGKYLKLNAIEGAVAAGEPVVLKGAAGFYGFVPTTGATKAAANDLMGAAEDVEAAGNYILAKPEGEPVGFYRASAGTIKAGKAYLGVAAPGVKAFLFDEDGATGINAVEKASENGPIYNIAGQRLNKMQKGINIVNGKKVLF